MPCPGFSHCKTDGPLPFRTPGQGRGSAAPICDYSCPLNSAICYKTNILLIKVIKSLFILVDVDEIEVQLVDTVDGIQTRVESLPTFLLCQDGKEIAAFVGTKQFRDFSAKIETM